MVNQGLEVLLEGLDSLLCCPPIVPELSPWERGKGNVSCGFFEEEAFSELGVSPPHCPRCRLADHHPDLIGLFMGEKEK